MESKIKNTLAKKVDNIVNQYNENYSDETVAKTKEFINHNTSGRGIGILTYLESALSENQHNDGVFDLLIKGQIEVFMDDGASIIDYLSFALNEAIMNDNLEDVFRYAVAHDDVTRICFDECGGEHDPGSVWSIAETAGELYFKSKGLPSSKDRSREEYIQARKDIM